MEGWTDGGRKKRMEGGTDGPTNGWTNDRTGGWTNGGIVQMEGRMERRRERQRDGRKDERTDGRTAGRSAGRTEGRTDERKNERTDQPKHSWTDVFQDPASRSLLTWSCRQAFTSTSTSDKTNLHQFNSTNWSRNSRSCDPPAPSVRAAHPPTVPPVRPPSGPVPTRESAELEY